MSIPSFTERRDAWSSPPVDDVGYLRSDQLLDLSNERLAHLVEQAERSRYGGWRNHNGQWRRVLGLDSTTDKDVLDYGCGIGIEALQYARTGNKVTVADIAASNIELAQRILSLEGHAALGLVIKEQPPFLAIARNSFDIIHCAGVLHHIPQPKPVVKQMAQWLRPGGELRLMVYSDLAWRIATGDDSEPPQDVHEHPLFDRYWTHWDPHGGYADWYNLDRLQERFGNWFDVELCQPLTWRGEYIGAVLRKQRSCSDGTQLAEPVPFKEAG